MVRWRRLQINGYGFLMWEHKEFLVSHTLGKVDFRKEGEDEKLKAIFSLKRIVKLKQIHSAKIYSTEELNPYSEKEGDGLYTKEREIGLMILTADCLPIVIYHPYILMLLHVGWKGLKEGVVVRGLEIFKKFFYYSIKDLITVFGPCIGPCCYEVGEDMIGEVSRNLPYPIEEVIKRRNDKLYFNLPKAASIFLEREGVKNIVYSPVCTCCSKHLHSFRRDKEVAGRAATVAWIRR